jgi:hypothetical protein
VGVGAGMGNVFKRERRGTTVGTKMDGRDGATRVGQVVDRMSGAAWAGLDSRSYERA